MSSIGHRISSHIKKHFTPKNAWKDWKAGKGPAGFYNPVKKISRDSKVLSRGWKSGRWTKYMNLFGSGANNASSLSISSGSSPYGSSGSIIGRY